MSESQLPVLAVRPQGQAPIVGVVMGSDSDWDTMRAASDVLADWGVPHEVGVVSAHRMPLAMVEYGRTAADRGIRVIIAGAGGAAHLPGMLAAVTRLPVIGVPVPLAYLDGQDSLLSIVQMPTGVPVATVGIGNAANAGILAARIIATADDAVSLAIRASVDDGLSALEATARSKGDSLARRVEGITRPAGFA